MKLDIMSKLAPIGMKVSKHKPELLLAAGVVSILGGTVLACKATLKVPEHLEEREEAYAETAKEIVESNPEVESKELTRAKTVSYLKMGVKIGKDYAPAVLLLGGGICMVISGHNTLRARLGALGAAYATLEQSYEKYRGRVIEDYGTDVDRKYRLGIRDVEFTEIQTTKKGKEKEVTKVEEAVHADGSDYSLYTRYFDEYNAPFTWNKSMEANFDFLRLTENIANEKFKRQGYLFLNDVYEALGFKKVSEGQLVGWVKGAGDDYIDFGIWEARNADCRDFVNHGWNQANCFVLDFNVDGVMWDLI